MDPGSETNDTGGHREDDLSDLIRPALLWLQDTVTMAMLQTRLKVLQGAVLVCALGLLLWTAIFLYGSFYYSYMPTATYTTPVHYYYRADCDSSDYSLCSFPMANISLLRNGKKPVMNYGQPYRISLELEMPESPANQELGMFMVRMSCYTGQGQTVVSSARSINQLVSASSSRFAMLRYHSGLLRALGTLLFFPIFLAGASEQRQLVEVVLFSDHIENSYFPSIGAVIEIQSRRVQIYSAQLYIHAHFTGIRYFLFNFPLLSAVMGVASNFAFLSVLLLFSYMQLIWGQLLTPRKVRDRPRLHRRSDGFQSQMDQNEDTGNLQDHQDDTRETENSSSNADALQEAFPIKISNLSQEDDEETIFQRGGGEMVLRHRGIQSEVEEETVAEKGVESMSLGGGFKSWSEIPKNPESTPSPDTGTCLML